LTGFFIYIHFQLSLLPLQRYYLPYYLRTETAGLTHPISSYQLLYVSDGESPHRVALDADVELGPTAQFEGRPLSLALTPQAAQDGAFCLIREWLNNYQNKALHAWIAHWIYEDVPVYRLFHAAIRFWYRCVCFAASFRYRRTSGGSKTFAMNAASKVLFL
jgi:hypothetical protein